MDHMTLKDAEWKKDPEPISLLPLFLFHKAVGFIFSSVFLIMLFFYSKHSQGFSPPSEQLWYLRHGLCCLPCLPFFSDLISYHCTTCPSCSSHTGFFAIPKQDKTCSHHRAFALALHYARKALPPVAAPSSSDLCFPPAQQGLPDLSLCPLLQEASILRSCFVYLHSTVTI